MKWKVKAIGAGSKGRLTAIQESYASSSRLEHAETLAVRMLKKVKEEDAMCCPFGVGFMIPGVHRNGPSLQDTDPSETYMKWK